jgi:TolB-like protein/class 3 adenylate cyclase
MPAEIDTDHPPAAQPARLSVAILAADVFGFSRLMDAEEAETHARLLVLRKFVLEPLLLKWHGTLVKTTGDGFIAYFAAPDYAVNFAMDFHRGVADCERDNAPDRRVLFRIGLNFGPVIIEDNDIYGSAVNIAARLEQAAPPGGILVTEDLRSGLTALSSGRVLDLGPIYLKNIAAPCRVFAIEGEGVSVERSRHGHLGVQKPASPPVVAVLPFVDQSRPADRFFGRGIVDDIIVGLSSLADLFVISRGSTLTFSGEPGEHDLIQTHLNARYVVSGTVRRSSQRLRINVQLADLDRGVVLWADHFDGKAADVFDFQDEISTQIVSKIAPHIREAEIKRALRKRPESLDAYELLLIGIDRLHADFEHFTEARSILERSMQQDGRYASSFAYAALWHNFNFARGWSAHPPTDASEASRLAACAIERDPHHGLALAMFGHVRSFLFRDYETARSYLERAKATSPSSSMAWALSSATHSYTGRFDIAVGEVERALRLSPLDPQSFFFMMIAGIAHYAAGRFEDAARWGYRSYGQHPQTTGNLRTLAASLVALDRRQEAQMIAARLREQDPRFNLTDYECHCPWSDPDTRRLFIDRLRSAGLPD